MFIHCISGIEALRQKETFLGNAFLFRLIKPAVSLCFLKVTNLIQN
ncbi:hypothetical protein A464_675 [Salmonella bongori N268-08]|uniref:Uncharacterized protein n=1 Tax=Salmonella bongori N268-08 TaxID=1197719 RepID=S5MMJ4_SALBN|nr:hypothetical protein A464_675 [Salmonella bongori N268-08]